MRELGAGGGKGDLDPKHELEFGDAEAVAKMLEAYEAKFKDQPDVLSKMWQTAAAAVESGAQTIDLDVSALGLKDDGVSQGKEGDFDVLEDMPLQKLLPALAGWLQKVKQDSGEQVVEPAEAPSPITMAAATLPKHIVSPFSSHHLPFSRQCPPSPHHQPSPFR